MLNITKEEINDIIGNITDENSDFWKIVNNRTEEIKAGRFMDSFLPSEEDMAKAQEQIANASAQALSIMENMDIEIPTITQEDIDEAQRKSDELLKDVFEKFGFNDDAV